MAAIKTPFIFEAANGDSYVTTSNDVVDATLNKRQSVINSELNQAVRNEAAARAQAVSDEAAARAQAVSDEAAARAQAVSDAKEELNESIDAVDDKATQNATNIGKLQTDYTLMRQDVDDIKGVSDEAANIIAAFESYQNQVSEMQGALETAEEYHSNIDSKHEEDIESLNDTIDSVKETIADNADTATQLVESEQEARINQCNSLDDKILELQSKISQNQINYLGIAVSEAQLAQIPADDINVTSWALVGSLDSLKLWAYYKGSAPTGVNTDTWVKVSDTTYNFGSIGMNAGFEYVLESELQYENRKNSLNVELNKLYFTYE